MAIQTYPHTVITAFVAALEQEVFNQKGYNPAPQQGDLFIDVLFMMGEIAGHERNNRPHAVMYPATLRLAGYLIRYTERLSRSIGFAKTPAEIINGFITKKALIVGNMHEQLQLLTSETGYMMVEEDNDHFSSLDRITWHAILICFREFSHLNDNLQAV